MQILESFNRKKVTQCSTCYIHIFLILIILDVVHEFISLGSTVSETLSLDTDVSRRIGHTSTRFDRLTSIVWEKELKKITTNNNIGIYRACVVSVVHYGSKTCGLYYRQG